jgi:CRP-like cAMP-binding protein
LKKKGSINGGNRVGPERAALEAQVAAHPFFIGMNAHYICLLADCAMATRFEKDHVIFRAGEPANRFYLIESGKVVLESGEDAGGALVITVRGTATPILVASALLKNFSSALHQKGLFTIAVAVSAAFLSQAR